MSQAGVTSISSSGGGAVVETLTGNSGGAVGPDASFNINVIGNNTSGINVVGMPASNTLTIVGIQSTTTQQGTITLATNAEAIAGTDTAKAVTSDDLKAKLGTQTANSVALFEGSSSAMSLASPSVTSGVPLISQGAAADPIFGTALVAGGGTGDTSFVVYAPICGGVTTTGALQSADSGMLNVGYILTSNGSAALPSWQANVPMQTVTYVSTTATTYVATATDYYISCRIGEPNPDITVQLPNAPSTGRVFVIKDRNGQSNGSNIHVTTPGGVVTFDGSTTFTLPTQPYVAINVIFNGTNYEVF